MEDVKFLLKKQEKKIRLQAISLLFESVSSSIEVLGCFWFTGCLMPTYSFTSVQQKLCYLMVIFGLWGFYILQRLMFNIYKRNLNRTIFPSLFPRRYKQLVLKFQNIIFSMMTLTVLVTSTLQELKQWNLYFSFLMVFTGRESVNSFLNLYKMGGGGFKKASY